MNTALFLRKNVYMIKCKGISYIRWRTLLLLVSFFTILLLVCFSPYPGSNGESILQHILFEKIG